jgi:hypothetical protein
LIRHTFFFFKHSLWFHNKKSRHSSSIYSVHLSLFTKAIISIIHSIRSIVINFRYIKLVHTGDHLLFSHSLQHSLFV